MARKQRRRPEAAIEVVYEDEQYSAIALYASPPDDIPIIHAYAKPYRDLMFKAFDLGMYFECKRCKRAYHVVSWLQCTRKVQTDMPPYKVLCVEATDKPTQTWLVRSDEYIPDHMNAHSIYTITGDMTELILRIASYLTSIDEIVG